MTEVVAALILKDGKFFAGKRPPHKKRGLLYEFVGGKVEPGETREQALTRECREELGCYVLADSLYTDVIHEYPDLTVHLYIYLAHIESGTPQLLEHVEHRWMSPDEAKAEEFCPADKEILEMIRKDFGRSHAE